MCRKERLHLFHSCYKLKQVPAFCVMDESKASMAGKTSSDDRAAARLDALHARIADAARGAWRQTAEVTLVAVSKTFDEEVILPLIEAGQRVFGENRVQEAARKWPGLREHYADIELHLIGPLQTNKVEEALALFDVIHTLDRERLALALVRAREKGTTLPRLLVQVNTGEEPQKAGLLPAEVDGFIARCHTEWQFEIEGLMCIPPANEEPALHFALLERLAQRNGLRGLSMGMSGDFEKAIALGATHVRVGSALFGVRD
jgi:pyridoxal phosphate enzyme (YggS family)